VDAGQDSVEPPGEPPVGAAHEDHERWHEQHADDGGVEEHGDGQTEADHLGHWIRAGNEGARNTAIMINAAAVITRAVARRDRGQR
jgi:hypothetical protein